VGNLVGEKELDRAKLPKEYEQKVDTAKPGTLLGISFAPDDGDREKVYFIDQNIKQLRSTADQ
jgi:hypothetical protein